MTHGWRAAVGPTAWMLGGAVVGRAAMLLAMVVVARQISPSEFGAVSLMQTVIVFMAGVGGLGLGVAVSRQTAHALTTDAARAAAYIRAAVLVTAGGAAALGVLLLVGARPAADLVLGGRDLAPLVRAVVPAILFGAVCAVIQASLLGLEEVRSLAVAQWAQGIGVAAGMIIGAEVDAARGTLLGLSIGQALAAGASVALLAAAMRRRGLAEIAPGTRADLRELWRIGLPTFAGSMAIFGAMLIAQVVLRNEPGGAAEVAEFNVAYRWHLAILFIPAAVAPLLIPVVARLAAGNRDDAAGVFRRGALAATVASAVPALVICLLASMVLGLSGAFYARDTTTLIVLGLATIPSALNTVVSSTGISLGLVRPWLLSDLTLAVVLVGAAIVLVPSGGAGGLAIAYLAAYTATNAVLAPPVVRTLGRP